LCNLVTGEEVNRYTGMLSSFQQKQDIDYQKLFVSQQLHNSILNMYL